MLKSKFLTALKFIKIILLLNIILNTKCMNIIDFVISFCKLVLFNYVIISLIPAYELWFKQILFEMDIVRKLLVANLWVCNLH